VTPRHVTLRAPDGATTHAVLVRLGRGRRWADVRVCGVVLRFALTAEPAAGSPWRVLVAARVLLALVLPAAGPLPGEGMEG